MSKKKKWTTQYIVKDPYFLEAKKQWYRARSAFKLIEIQDHFSIIKPGMNILDVASAPGSFLQVISRIIKENGVLVGVDIQAIKPLWSWNVYLFQGDIFEFEPLKAFFNEKNISSFDLITSDIAPNTTGITGVDQYRSIELNQAILTVSQKFLKKWGNLLLKVFVGEDIGELIAPIKEQFITYKRFKPKACRERSFEEYFICLNKK